MTTNDIFSPTKTFITQRDVPMCLRSYQENGLEKCEAAGDTFLFGHDMGTGKTFTAIKWLVENNIYIALIVCPKAVLDVWPIEIKKFKSSFPSIMTDTFNYNVIVLNENDGSVEKKAEKMMREIKKSSLEKRRVIVVINYDSFWRAPLGMTVVGKKIESLGYIGAIKWQAMILDESHRIKDPASRASLYSYHLGKAIRKKILLTGTPMPNSPLDLFGQFRTIDPTILGSSFYAFKQMYANFKDLGGFKKFVGMKNEKTLIDKLSKYIDIVHSNDVLDLPPTQDIQILVDLGAKAQKIYRALESDLYAEIDEGSLTVDTALVKMLRLCQVTGGSLPFDDENDERKIVVIDKAKEEALDDLLEDVPIDEPIVVFCKFRHEIDFVLRVFEKQKRKHGELSGRKNDYKAFYNGNIDALVAQLRSGGLGVDFTRARLNYYIDPGLSLGDFLQTRKRSHRSGQTRDVIYYHLIARGTIDVKVYENLDKKENLVKALMNQIRSR